MKTSLLALALAATASAALAADPLFDFDAIAREPVEMAILSTETTNGIVFQDIEYTTRRTNGAPERLRGILAFPENGTNLPGVFWSMGGMAKASRSFPGVLAAKGYACLAITLPHALRNSFRIPFDTAHPDQANLTLLARDQFRAITVLSQLPQVDSNRLAAAGASYGGVFATLIAGADPRIKAGFSFFGGGHHELGTSLPQFLKMTNLADLAVWQSTIDPALRLKNKPIPFLWGVAFNDHWFHFPALSRTHAEAAGSGKRLFILPGWQHGFPPEIDRTLFDFLDTTPVSPHPRPAYALPSTPGLRVREGRPEAFCGWTGAVPVVRAELVVSYGMLTPWLGWPHRASHTFPARVEGLTAAADLPVPASRLELLYWFNLYDTDGHLVSTPAERSILSAFPVTSNLVLNAFVDGDLADKALAFYRMHGEPLAGEAVSNAAFSGGVALRIPGQPLSAKTDASFSIRHFHSVPMRAHRLTLRVKADEAATLFVRLTPVRPPQWSAPVVASLIQADPLLAPLLPRWKDPVVPLSVETAAGPEWRDVVLDVPKPEAPVDGYRLDVGLTGDKRPAFWLDTLRMEPLWTE